MNIDEVRLTTLKSNKLLELAKRYAMDAESFPPGQDRERLEQEAKRLIAEARELTTRAKEQTAKYR
jgi:hypothetical protein